MINYRKNDIFILRVFEISEENKENNSYITIIKCIQAHKKDMFNKVSR